MSTIVSPKPDPNTQERMPTMTSATPDRNLERLIEVLERELDAARLREQAASDREARLWRLMEQRALRPDPEGPLPAPQARHEERNLTIRQRILAVLQQHPGGLHRLQIEEQLGNPKRLTNTLGHMKRNHLIIHRGSGLYALPAPVDGTEA